MLAVLGLALSLSAGLRAQPDDAGLMAAMPGPAVAVAADAREGDPHQGEQHGEFPVKKPRVGSLRVRNSRAAAGAATRRFHLQCPTSTPDAGLRARAVASSPAISAPRADPALRLHPGQAPPRVA